MPLDEKLMEVLEGIQKGISPVPKRQLAYAGAYSSGCDYCSESCSGGCKNRCIGGCTADCGITCADGYYDLFC